MVVFSLSSCNLTLFQLRVDGCKWSTPFSVSDEGAMRVSLRKAAGGDQLQFRVVIRSGTKSSRYEVIFRCNSLSSPYRLYFEALYFLSENFPYYSSLSGVWNFAQRVGGVKGG